GFINITPRKAQRPMNLKPLTVIIVCSALLAPSALFAQNKHSKKQKSSSTTPASNSTGSKTEGATNSEGSLESVLTQMDTAAANFRSAEADLVWEQYQKVVDETDTQKGKIYFRRTSKETQAAIHITSPDTKYIVYSE